MTRMFDIHPALMCDKHTGSEWAELSQEAGLINRYGWNSTKGHAQNFQINVDNIPKRREELKQERRRRGKKADNYTEIDEERFKQGDRIHGITIDSLTMEIMDNKAGRKDTMDIEPVDSCTCLNHEQSKKRVKQIWKNL